LIHPKTTRNTHNVWINARGLGEVAWMSAIMLGAFALGLCLARLNVFAVAVASAISAGAAFAFYAMMQDSTPAYSVLLALATLVVLQVGYLIGQFLRKLRG
jgi:hypothetical protein